MRYRPKTQEEIQRENMETLRQMRPLDDDLMRMIFRDNLPLAQLVLRIITGIDDLELVSEKTQHDLKRLVGARSICLDVFGRDSEGRLYDMEIQRDDSGADPHRARYHSAAIDIEFLDKASDFASLPDAYVIFITERDIFGGGKALYRIDRMNRDMDTPFSDGEHIIYVNGAYYRAGDTSDIAKLMHDFRCSDYNDMNFELMAQSVRYYKEETKGVVSVSRLMEARIEAERKYTILGLAEKMIESREMTLDKIANLTGLTLEEVKELAEELKVSVT